MSPAIHDLSNHQETGFVKGSGQTPPAKCALDYGNDWVAMPMVAQECWSGFPVWHVEVAGENPADDTTICEAIFEPLTKHFTLRVRDIHLAEQDGY